MTQISINQNLPFVTVTLRANGKTVQLPNILLDTGSAATIFKTDDLIELGIQVELTDRIRTMVGIGGSEVVVEKQIEAIKVGEIEITPFKIQMGALDYGYSIRGILGLDFLLRASVILDFKNLEIRQIV
ncbi:MAG: hypothetical protein BroJett018_19070 [Chloroflexota bacterium]|nr:hypothetical protein [Chloroflexota bacterium]GIK64113.1 MAG: hypothetical protein BroJett018_19070 [Chloroflexota bacterium]